MFTRLTTLASALALGATLAACGSANSNESSDLTADPNGHLRIGYVIPPAPLNPYKVASDIGAYSYLTPVYDRLTQLVTADGGGGELAPMVATEWVFAEDSKSATFTLRDDVTFVDGVTLDAAAVKANFDHALTAPGSTIATHLSMIESIDAVDATHVRFNTKRPAADLPYVLAGAVGSLVSPQALNNPDLDVNPVGSGPYIATSVKIGDSVEYERREGYWDPEAQLAKTITITGIVDDNARVNALRSGQIDMMYSMVTGYDQASSLGRGFDFYSYPEANVYTFYLNTSRPNVDNVKFRQALNFAVDREGISRSLTSGQCAPTAQPFASSREGYLADPPVEYIYDPERARELLKESGVVNATVTAVLPTGLSLHEAIASAVQDQFREIGVTLDIRQADVATTASDYAAGSYDAYIQSRTPMPAANQTLARYFLNTRSFPGTVPDGLEEAIFESYDPALSDTERKAVIEGATSIATEQALDVFICSVPTQFAYSDKVLNVEEMGISNFLGIFDARYLGIAST
ncbi:ABC transporter substrate-binding protein [Rhodococcus sp. NPDC056743]|uniref:ABC transporter substrate-binding protein n=1 Tax=Rhodococcus sp. NPDC056743 TaxID=3345934 RepID=UPI00366B0EB2